MTDWPWGSLTDAQLDGLACVVCGSFDRPMVPVGDGPRGQLFACVEHEREAVRRLGVTRDTRENGPTADSRASNAIRPPVPGCRWPELRAALGYFNGERRTA